MRAAGRRRTGERAEARLPSGFSRHERGSFSDRVIDTSLPTGSSRSAAAGRSAHACSTERRETSSRPSLTRCCPFFFSDSRRSPGSPGPPALSACTRRCFPRRHPEARRRRGSSMRAAGRRSFVALALVKARLGATASAVREPLRSSSELDRCRNGPEDPRSAALAMCSPSRAGPRSGRIPRRSSIRRPQSLPSVQGSTSASVKLPLPSPARVAPVGAAAWTGQVDIVGVPDSQNGAPDVNVPTRSGSP